MPQENPTTEELKRRLGAMIWKTATSLVHGGKVSSVQFMDYMLGALFYRFISEDIADYCKSQNWTLNYAKMSDEQAMNARDTIVKLKGFFILPSQLFINVANSARYNTNLNTTLANNFRAIEQSALGTSSEDDVRGLFDNFDTDNKGLAQLLSGMKRSLNSLKVYVTWSSRNTHRRG